MKRSLQTPTPPVLRPGEYVVVISVPDTPLLGPGVLIQTVSRALRDIGMPHSGVHASYRPEAQS